MPTEMFTDNSAAILLTINLPNSERKMLTKIKIHQKHK